MSRTLGLGNGASKNRKANIPGLKKARKTARRAYSESSLSVEEIIARLNRLDAEMAERKPQRGSSAEWKFLKRRSAALKRLDRGKKYLKGRNRLEADDKKKKMEMMEEEGEDIALKRAMNEEEKMELRVFNEGVNLLAAALLGDSIPDGGVNFYGQLMI